MIRLTRNDPPEKLTAEFVKEKTDHFKATGDSVWHYEWLKDSLTAMSHEKCAYCECKLGQADSYMEVEHFKDKKDYPDDVLKWENLLPSCKRCNVNKSDHNVVAEPIINPFETDPVDHIYFSNFFFRVYDRLGWDTIDVLNLNEDPRLVAHRFEIGGTLLSTLSERRRQISELDSDRKWKIFRKRFSNLMDECLPQSIYSALCATLFLETPDSGYIIDKLKEKGLWNAEEETKLNTICSIALKKHKADFVPN